MHNACIDKNGNCAIILSITDAFTNFSKTEKNEIHRLSKSIYHCLHLDSYLSKKKLIKRITTNDPSASKKVFVYTLNNGFTITIRNTSSQGLITIDIHQQKTSKKKIKFRYYATN